MQYGIHNFFFRNIEIAIVFKYLTIKNRKSLINYIDDSHINEIKMEFANNNRISI